jgi:L-fuculose-phosphate aldolase
MTEVWIGDLRAVGAEVCEVCRWLHARNLLAAADGNLSVRLADGRIAITPAGVSKARLLPDQMAILTLDGAVLVGQPSSERLMHLAVYSACPDARAVVHAHPPTAIAWTIAQPDRAELPGDVLPEVMLGVGAIPIVPYARPGTAAVGTALTPYLPHHRALILARHGVVCWGESLVEAYNGVERIEHAAQILKSAHELGALTALPAAEVAALGRVRAAIGPRIL